MKDQICKLVDTTVTITTESIAEIIASYQGNVQSVQKIHHDMMYEIAFFLSERKNNDQQTIFKYDKDIFSLGAKRLELLDAVLPKHGNGWVLSEYQFMVMASRILPEVHYQEIIEHVLESIKFIRDESTIVIRHAKISKEDREAAIALSRITEKDKLFTETRKVLQGVLKRHLNLFTVKGMEKFVNRNGMVDMQYLAAEITIRIYQEALGVPHYGAKEHKNGILGMFEHKNKPGSYSLRHNMILPVDTLSSEIEELEDTDYSGNIQKIEHHFLMSLLDLCTGEKHVHVQDIFDELAVSIKTVMGDHKPTSFVAAAAKLLKYTSNLDDMNNVVRKEHTPDTLEDLFEKIQQD